MTFQLGSALLDACVLATLHKEDTYGYRLTQEVKVVMSVSESTLYPVLRRLMREGYLETYDQQHMGRNRRNKYREYVEEWKAFSTKISGILEGGKEHEEG